MPRKTAAPVSSIDDLMTDIAHLLRTAGEVNVLVTQEGALFPEVKYSVTGADKKQYGHTFEGAGPSPKRSLTHIAALDLVDRIRKIDGAVAEIRTAASSRCSRVIATYSPPEDFRLQGKYVTSEMATLLGVPEARVVRALIAISGFDFQARNRSPEFPASAVYDVARRLRVPNSTIRTNYLNLVEQGKI